MDKPSNSTQADSESVEKFDNLIQNAYKTIVKCTRAAQSFPSVHENSLLIASPSYISNVAVTSDRVMTLVDKLLKSQNISKSMSKLYLEGQKDILIEANDKLLESINTRIDIMAGTKTSNTVTFEPKVVKESWNKNAKSSNVWQEVKAKKTKNFNIFSSGTSVERPQLKFKDKVNNSYDVLFEPKLKEKPNALKPLAILLEKYDAVESFSHPYEYELDLFTPKDKFLVCDEPQVPLALEATPLILVNEPAQVAQLVDELLKHTEIAVDLEYHNYRSFQGYTCLMQISTREKDYIVDTLKLRDDLQNLNEVFTNPNILKVFHGGDSDIKWLQKDFGIYVVGMFDTHQACKFLPLPRQSLAYLLKHYCEVDSDKTFQLFDWRRRPLPEEAIKYARSDTHYLLYLYDCMKKDLTDVSHGKKNLIVSTFTNSRNICKMKYEKPVFIETGFTNIFRSHALLNNQQIYALKELYKWRDKTARDMDESIGYVLPNHMLLQIAQSIPRDVQGIFACCNPVPGPVKEHVLTIHSIILKARLQPLTRVIEKVKPEDAVGVSKVGKKTVAPPHDSMDSQCYKGLPPVFTDKLSINNRNMTKPTTDNNQGSKAKIGLFFEDQTKTKSNKFNKIKLRTSRFETPYRRFLKSKEYAKAIEKKLEKENNNKKTREVEARTTPLAAIIKIEDSPKASVPSKVCLKQVKCEEHVEKEKEKRKKILREREEDTDTSQQPITKKIKTENEQVVGENKKENKDRKIKCEPEESGKRENKAVTTVDYSNVNYNKYMVKGKKNEKNRRGKKKKTR